MVQLATKKLTFDDYLHYEDGSDVRYEFVNGELIPMPPASGLHALILRFLFLLLEEYFQSHKLDYVAMPGTTGLRTSIGKSRIPDITVLDSEQWQQLKTTTTAILEVIPPLIIEIVSTNRDDDYRYKRSEYAAIEVPEYWIVDPQDQKVSVLTLVDGFYEVEEFKADEPIKSSLLPQLEVSAKIILDR